jgi:hypothetical protein
MFTFGGVSLAQRESASDFENSARFCHFPPSQEMAWTGTLKANSNAGSIDDAGAKIVAGFSDGG